MKLALPRRFTLGLMGVALAALLPLLASCAHKSGASVFHYKVPEHPEGSSGYTEKPGWATRHFAVAAANPLATDAGYQVLRAGGSAIDAAVAVQMVLTLVEPQSSGIGGGAFVLHHDGKQTQAYDGRETAPATATESLFLGADGKPMPFYQAVVGGRSVGVPGTLRVLELAHREHGKLPWASLFEPAITLAEQGFKVSARLSTLLGNEPHLKLDPVAAAYFYDKAGKPWPIGHKLQNPELAQVLRRVAREGVGAFYQGEIAQAVVNKVRQHPTNPGLLSLTDMAAYRAEKRAPLCHDWRASERDWRICGFPPPSSGAIAVGQILGLLQHSGAQQYKLENGLPNAAWLHLYLEASRLAFADRAQYLGDPAFVSAPAGDWASLLSPAYLAERAKLIGTQAMPQAPAGTPRGASTAQFAPMAEQVEYGTSHISIVDARGNAVAMTTTIEDGFGARQMVKGFLLNNELSDFSFAPSDAAGRPVANRVQPGKRPRSSMSPSLVFDKSNGQLVMSAGSPGGALIIHYTAKTLYGVLGWGLTPQQAINLPNFGSTGGPALLEEKRFSADIVRALSTRGHQVREQNMTSGLQAITRGQAHGQPMLLGGADPRREGVVMGD